MTVTAPTRTAEDVAASIKADLTKMRTLVAKNIVTLIAQCGTGHPDSLIAETTDHLARTMHKRDAIDYALRDWDDSKNVQELRERFRGLCGDLAGKARGSKMTTGSERPRAYWETLGDIFNDMNRALSMIEEIERNARG